MTTTREQYAEVLAAHGVVPPAPNQVDWRCACGGWVGWHREYVAHVADALAAALPDPEQRISTLESLLSTAQVQAERNMEDAAHWHAHFNRTHGAKTGVWVNADGSNTRVLPATTASAEVDWQEVALRTLHGAGRRRLAWLSARRRAARLREALPDPEQTVREARAAAWDEGYKVGEPYGYAPNPYREARP